MKTGAARRLEPEPENPAPEDFIEEIRRIINSGTLKGTREVAARGLELYPDHPELRRLHHELRPFESRTIPGYRISDPRPAYEWLQKNSEKFLGKWVGLVKGELVASADTLQEVLKALEGRDPRDTIVHHILE
jgi:uncharacterized protein DUF5678